MANTISTSFTQADATLRATLAKIQNSFTRGVLNSGGLAIGSGSKKKIKVANTVYYVIDGVMYSKTSAEITLTTTSNVTNALFNVILVSVNSAGTLTATPGTEGATLGAVVLGTPPTGDLVLGFVIINPTGTGNFVGGTTDLDDATVAPGAVYVNTAPQAIINTGIETL